MAKYNAKLQEKDNQLMITRHEEQVAKLSQKRLTQKLEDALEQLKMEKAYKREVELGAKIACERLYFAIQENHRHEPSNAIDVAPNRSTPGETMKPTSDDTPKDPVTTKMLCSDTSSYSYSSDDDAPETSEVNAGGVAKELSCASSSKHLTTKQHAGHSDDSVAKDIQKHEDKKCASVPPVETPKEKDSATVTKG